MHFIFDSVIRNSGINAYIDNLEPYGPWSWYKQILDFYYSFFLSIDTADD